MKFLKYFIRRKLIGNKRTWGNILGLVLGMFTFLFIVFYVYTERNYDSFLSNSDNIYHIEYEVNKNDVSTTYSNTPLPIAKVINEEVSGVKSYVTYCSIFETNILKIGTNDFLNPDILFANKEMPSFFNYQAITGNIENSLQVGKGIITQSAALRYFGKVDVVGESFELLYDKKTPFLVEVAAVIEDMPFNSNIQFEILCNLDDYVQIIGQWIDSWVYKASQSYITLEDGVELAQVENQITQVLDKYWNSKGSNAKGFAQAYLEPISEKHFYKKYDLQHPTETFVSKTTLNILLLVGIITLLISWLNYVNFLVYENTKYFTEIGIRKINGASRRSLILTLVKESMLLVLIPILITIVLFFVLGPQLYGLLHLEGMSTVDINHLSFWSLVFLMFVGGALVSSIFPILKLSRYQPIQLVRKGSNITTVKRMKGASMLTVQFILSLILIIGVLGIIQQLKFMDNQHLGFNEEDIIVLSAPVTEDANTYQNKMELFKNQANQVNGVVGLSASSSIPGKKMTTQNFGLMNKPESINKYLILMGDGDYFNVIDCELLAGRNFSDNKELIKNEVIINKQLARKLGFTDPMDAIGQMTNMPNKRIVGVVDNYHHYSLHKEIKPMLFIYGLNNLVYFTIKFSGKVQEQQLSVLQSNWEDIFVHSPFESTALKTEYRMQYAEDKKLSNVVMIFSFISVLITILGLVSTCLNIIQQRIKEIGIRKVNGAKVHEVLTMLNLSFVKWVALAFIIACPLAYYAMNLWLENFAYKAQLDLCIFAISGLIAVGITLITVSWQSWKAATRNPVESLRYE
ncbi:ABC transporter permease [Labilibacter marinus]|uniref:ABC transporter permease n=1 Tax=Labilibacter marinus TaxID=1477105 RepID=UPI00094FA5E2|nr:ABC transporter permease [Labilibacter marinus]